MFQKVITTSLYFNLLLMSALFQLTVAVSNQKLSKDRIEQLFRRKSILEQLLKSSRANENPWLKEKRNPSYTDPCKSKTKMLDVKLYLDDGNDETFYIPEKLRETECIRGNSISPRDNPICKEFNGDCRNIRSIIDVLKITRNPFSQLRISITYNVGCACKIVN